MINKKYLKLQRNRSINSKGNFIYEIISKRIIDSIDLINITFKEVLEIGINDNKIFDYINNKFSNWCVSRYLS